MAESDALAIKISRQPATIDFIDNRLPRYHEAFDRPPVRYDVVSGKFYPKTQAAILAGVDQDETMLDLTSTLDIHSGLPARPVWTDTQAMQYWSSVFPGAMTQFQSATTEPKSVSKSPHRIREKEDWEEVYDTLECARATYQPEQGKMGWFRKLRRKAADNVAPVAELARIANKMAPDDPCVTPVLGAVQILFEAVKTASAVRIEILGAFDGIIPIFSDVELFLGTFPKDLNIRNAAVDLTVTTLHAIEQTIGFFISNDLVKAGKAVFMGNTYESGLLESLARIKEKSRSLMEEAAKSHIHEFHMCKFPGRGLEENSVETRSMHKNLLEAQQSIANGINAINNLLADHLHQKDRELEAARKELSYLQVENDMLRTQPLLQHQIFPIGAPPPEAIIEWYINAETLRQMLGALDLDLADTRFIAEKRAELPAREQTQAEQIVSTQAFRNWIVGSSSSKLLVQWDTRPPKSVAGISPLSVFCTTMAQALRAQERFVSALWFCGRHTDSAEAGTHGGGRGMLISLIDQLLRQFSFDTRSVHRDVNLVGLQQGSLPDLARLLEWLARRLPETMTLFFIVDGVVFFERDEFEAEALDVFSTLLRLCSDSTVSATVKVLFTSTPGTDVVRGVFEKEDLILNVEGLPRLAWAPSDERMARELATDGAEN